jgi:ribose transport system ATP-binding protein
MTSPNSPLSPSGSADRSTPDGTVPAVTFRGVTKTFGGTVAVNNVDLTVYPGCVLALLGENGAGKSTLIKLLAGIYRPDAGTILLNGTSLDPGPRRSSIAFIHQDLGLIDWMTAAENVALVGGYARSRGVIRWRHTRRKASEILALIGGGIPTDKPVGELTRADRSLIAIARALSLHPSVLVLDEPTASLSVTDTERLFTALRDLKREGVAIIFVTHRLDEVFQVADRVAVMRDGWLIAEREICDVHPDELVSLIVGRALSGTVRQAAAAKDAPAGAAASQEPLLQLRDVRVAEVGPVSLDLRPGEIVAFTGLRGAGQDMIGRAVIGLIPITEGSITMKGSAGCLSSPAKALRAGCVFVTGNRQEEGIGMNLSVRENLFLNPALAKRRLFHLQTPRTERAQARVLIDRYRIRPDGSERVVNTLSGGNQQKVVFARSLQSAPELIVLEEPAIGVDVGAKAEIYTILREALHAGAAGILVSTDFNEVTQVCNRALVFRRGQVLRELNHGELSTEALVYWSSAAGVST